MNFVEEFRNYIAGEQADNQMYAKFAHELRAYGYTVEADIVAAIAVQESTHKEILQALLDNIGSPKQRLGH